MASAGYDFGKGRGDFFFGDWKRGLLGFVWELEGKEREWKGFGGRGREGQGLFFGGRGGGEYTLSVCKS